MPASQLATLSGTESAAASTPAQCARGPSHSLPPLSRVHEVGWAQGRTLSLQMPQWHRGNDAKALLQRPLAKGAQTLEASTAQQAENTQPWPAEPSLPTSAPTPGPLCPGLPPQTYQVPAPLSLPPRSPPCPYLESSQKGWTSSRLEPSERLKLLRALRLGPLGPRAKQPRSRPETIKLTL